MKCTLKIIELNENIIFEFPRVCYPFFYCYFGDELKMFNNEHGKTITYKFKFLNLKVVLEHKATDETVLLIPINQLIRALIRSIYQIAFPKSSSIGLFEYFVYLIRKSFLEPFEKNVSQLGFFLIHGAMVSKNNETILLVAGSRSGKSTVSKIYEDFGYDTFNDNYVFLNGNKIFTIPECSRYGVAKRFGFSFYGKGVYKAKKSNSCLLNEILWLSFSTSFSIVELSLDDFLHMLEEVYINEQEGAFKSNPIAVSNNYNSLRTKMTKAKIYRMNMIKDIHKTKLFIEEQIND